MEERESSSSYSDSESEEGEEVGEETPERKDDSTTARLDHEERGSDKNAKSSPSPRFPSEEREDSDLKISAEGVDTSENNQLLQESDKEDAYDEENSGRLRPKTSKDVFRSDDSDDEEDEVVSSRKRSVSSRKRSVSSESEDERLVIPTKKQRLESEEEEEGEGMIEDTAPSTSSGAAGGEGVGERLDLPMKKRRVESDDDDDDDDEDDDKKVVGEGTVASTSGSAAIDDVGNDSDIGERMRRVVGDSDDSDSEKEDDDDVVQLQEELVAEGQDIEEDEEKRQEAGYGGDREGQDSDNEDPEEGKRFEGLLDWDIMMEKRKSAMARARLRKKRDSDLTIHDDVIMDLIQQMREAAEQDRQLNVTRKAATKKIQLLPTIMGYLKKADLQTNFIECGILSALSEWLTPLPDHSLPHLKIRESILDTLKSFQTPDSTLLKSSKIGKAVMLLYQHPKEARKNREKAGKLINEWARPIFGLASDFRMMTRTEREERDYANLSQEARRRISTGEKRPSQEDEGSEVPQKPGDKGWIGRARVPMPSTKGYVVRPKWNVDQDFAKKPASKKMLNRYEQYLNKKKKEKVQNSVSHAVKISVEGRHMPL